MAKASETSPAHSPLPWNYDHTHGPADRPFYVYSEAPGPGGEDVIICAVVAQPGDGADHSSAEANARFIVRACRSHDDLLEACETLVDMVGSVAGNWENGRALAAAVQNLIRHAKAASGVIAKAKGRPA